MPERVRRDEGADEADLHAALNALSTMRFETPANHKEAAKAQRLDGHVAPVRECARRRCAAKRTPATRSIAAGSWSTKPAW